MRIPVSFTSPFFHPSITLETVIPESDNVTIRAYVMDDMGNEIIDPSFKFIIINIWLLSIVYINNQNSLLINVNLASLNSFKFSFFNKNGFTNSRYFSSSKFLMYVEFIQLR